MHGYNFFSFFVSHSLLTSFFITAVGLASRTSQLRLLHCKSSNFA